MFWELGRPACGAPPTSWRLGFNMGTPLSGFKLAKVRRALPEGL